MCSKIRRLQHEYMEDKTDKVRSNQAFEYGG